MTSTAGRISVNRVDHAGNRPPDALGSSPSSRMKDAVELGHGKQGRSPRAASEAGLQRIVNAMRAALRARQNIHVTRKEIAQFAGVTPALVTYYFPEKDDLIEAVTIPIVTAMVEAVQKSLSGGEDPREKLIRAVDVLIAAYATDAAIVDLFIAYRSSKADTLPDLIGTMDAAFVAFFDRWLQNQRDSVYDAVYLQKVAIGMCKIVARCDRVESSPEASRDMRRPTRAEAICAMLLEKTWSAEQPVISRQGAASEA